MPSGSKILVLSTSLNGCPAARATSTPSTWAPVLYIQRSPGWASSGKLPREAIQVSGSGGTGGSGGPIVASRSSPVAATTGHGLGEANISPTMPKPKVNVSRSRAVIARAAGTVSSSGPSIRRRTLRSASSGSSRSTGSSRSISPSAATARVTAAVMGLVVEAIRKIESRATGGPPTASVPSASTCTWPPRATSATRPGTCSSPTWRWAAACSPFSPAAVSPAAESITQPPRLHQRPPRGASTSTTSPHKQNHPSAASRPAGTSRPWADIAAPPLPCIRWRTFAARPPHEASAGEELGHDRRGGVGVEVMALSGENRQPPVWHRLCGCLRGVAQERRALLAGDHQGRDGDGGEQPGRHGTVTDDRRVVGEGVRDRLQAGTERGVPQLLHHPLGDADRLGLVQLDGVAAAARGNQAG